MQSFLPVEAERVRKRNTCVKVSLALEHRRGGPTK